MATKMEWDWVLGYPIFVYTTWLNPSHFFVKIVKGKKGDQNAPGYGPTARPWVQYEERCFVSKAEVVARAFKIAKYRLKREMNNPSPEDRRKIVNDTKDKLRAVAREVQNKIST